MHKSNKRKISTCKYTWEVAELLADKIKKMPKYANDLVEKYGPFGLSGESSVYVSHDNNVIGTITIHYSSESGSGFSYGKSREDRSQNNITIEKPLPDDIKEAIDCVFEIGRLEKEILPIINGLSDRECVAIHNDTCGLDCHKVFLMSDLEHRSIYDVDGKAIKARRAKGFDMNAPYFVVDVINPKEPYYFHDHELRSINHYDEIYDSPYAIKLTNQSPREMLASNVAFLGYADKVRNMVA